jgi:hypothetical protein
LDRLQSYLINVDGFQRSKGAFNALLDLTAQRSEIDWLGQKCLGAILKRFALGLSVTVSRDHDDRNIWPCKSRRSNDPFALFIGPIA